MPWSTIALHCPVKEPDLKLYKASVITIGGLAMATADCTELAGCRQKQQTGYTLPFKFLQLNGTLGLVVVVGGVYKVKAVDKGAEFNRNNFSNFLIAPPKISQ